ncbi:hypothetical protein ZTR_07643 [Talaromyces verruculosus]|nr:hypothetical protein ZTR_07643 [Talaromyces verruculosus]
MESTNEDRYHIGQAKEIENLRKELNRLKRRLENGEQQPQTQTQTQSQPHSQSYGSADGYDGSGAVAERPSKRRIGEDGNVTDLWNSVAPTAVAGMAYTGSIPFTQLEMSQQSYFTPTEQHQQYHQPADPSNNNPIMRSAEHPQYNLNQIQQHPQPDFWRGKQKQLETIYKIVCDCDEYWVPSIIDIVRTSPSPEDAITSIRILLRSGSSSQSNSYTYSSSSNSNDGGTVIARSTTTTASHSRSPDSASSMMPADVGYTPYTYDDYVTRFGRYVSPTDQSRSSGEG